MDQEGLQRATPLIRTHICFVITKTDLDLGDKSVGQGSEDGSVSKRMHSIYAKGILETTMLNLLS
jgi:hypothetical protein